MKKLGISIMMTILMVGMVCGLPLQYHGANEIVEGSFGDTSGNFTFPENVQIAGNVNVSGSSKVYTPELCLNGDCQTSWPSGSSSIWTDTSGNATYVSGNVGIGTITPDAKLNIVSSGINLTLARLENSDESGVGIELSNPQGTWNINNNYLGYLEFKILSTPTMYLTGTRVGIGITNPKEKLHVDGNINVTTDNDICITGGNCLSTVAGSGGGWTDGGSNVYLSNSSDNVGIGTTSPSRKLHIVDSTTPEFELGPNDGVNRRSARFRTHTTEEWIKIDFYDNSDTSYGDVLLVPQGGNVGIGTTSPASILHVQAPSGNTEVILNSSVAESVLVIKSKQGDTGKDSKVHMYLSNGTYFDIRGRSSESSLKFSYGATQLMTMKTDGKVGIGTTNPDAKLHIKENGELIHLESTSGIGDSFITFNNETSRHGYIGYGGSSVNDMIILQGEESPIRIFTDNIERIRISESGDVGIGTTTPGAKLDVQGATHIGAGTVVSTPRLGLWGGFETGGTKTKITANNVYNGTSWFKNSAYGGWDMTMFGDNTGDATDDYISFKYKTQGTTGGEGTDVMTITGDGNVGIGTTTPSTSLHIEENSTNNALISIVTDNADAGIIMTDDTNSYQMSLRNDVSDSLVWRVNSVDKLVLTSAGNLGIGTTTPSQKLDVVGSVNVSTNIYYGGNLTGYGADFAEKFGTNEELSEGDVVCLQDNGKISKCQNRGDNSVVGIVSFNPTIIGNGAQEGVPVGIVGIVPTKVKGPIDKFDLITTSPGGYGEKASIEDFGAIVGKAMESCEAEECIVKVLVGMR